MEKHVKAGDWIVINNYRNAVVCRVFDDFIEVVYLDDKNRAINEDAVWEDGKWRFVCPTPCGGYADHYDRLAQFVKQLRARQY
jgi:hypothetical protein